MICFVFSGCGAPVVETNDHPMQVINVDNAEATHLTVHKLDRKSRYRFSLKGRTGVGEGLPVVREGSTTLDGGTPAHFDFVFLVFSFLCCVIDLCKIKRLNKTDQIVCSGHYDKGFFYSQSTMECNLLSSLTI